MSRKHLLFIVPILFLTLVGWLWGYTLTRAQNETRSQAATAVGSTFTYQGRLNDGGAPATGSYDFQFALYDDAVAGSQVGSTINQTLAVSDGLFTTSLDFGDGVFDGGPRFLDIAVKLSGGGGYTSLTPRQAINAAPYASYADKVQPLANVVTVAKSGGDFTTINDALASITDASESNPYVIRIAPGVYTETVDLKSHVDLEGSGEGVTILRGSGGNTDPLTDGGSSTLRADGTITPVVAEIRFLTIESDGTGKDYAAAVWTESTIYLKLTHITIISNYADSKNYGALFRNYDGIYFPSAIMNNVIAYVLGESTDNYGVYSQSSNPMMTDTTLYVSSAGASNNFGIYNESSNSTIQNLTAEVLTYDEFSIKNYGIYNSNSDPTMHGVNLNTNGSSVLTSNDFNYGIFNIGSDPDMKNVKANVSFGMRSYGIYNENSSPKMTDVTVSSSDAHALNRGVYNVDSVPTMISVDVNADGGTSSIGMLNEGTTMLALQDSKLQGASNSISNGGGSSSEIANSMLDGPVTGGGDLTCTGVYNGDFVTLNKRCDFPAESTHVVHVGTDGGDFSTISAALAAITDAGESNPYVIRIAPGVYTETVDLKPYIDIEGSGEGITILRGFGSNTSPSSDSSSATLRADGIIAPEVRFLTVESDGTGNNYATAIWTNGTGPHLRLTHVTAVASNASANNYGIWIDTSSSNLNNVSVTASGASFNGNVGVLNISSLPTINNVNVIATGGGFNIGMVNNTSSPTLNNSNVQASGGSATGMSNSGSAPVVKNSTLIGSTGSVNNSGDSSAKIANTMLDGTATIGGGLTCVGAFNSSFVALNSSCQ